MQAIQRRSHLSAVAGGVVWLLLLFLPLGQDPQALIERLLLFAILVITPLALALVAPPDDLRWLARLYRAVCATQPIAALLAASAFFMPAGLLAGLLAAIWLVLTGLVALVGLGRLLRGNLRADELCIDAGLLFLPIGGLWLVAVRLGLRPLGFSDTIVLLTAAHFHYAGFAVPILAGLAGRVLADSQTFARRLFSLSAIGIIGGIPLVALGITFSRVLEIGAACVLAGSLLLLAGLIVIAIVPHLHHRLAQILLTISALASVVTMLLAAGYALAGITGLAITMPQMVLAHGITNAFGLALCGLLAWTIEIK